MNDTSLIDPDDAPEAELIPESQLVDGEPVPELPGMTDYPWANGDAATMLRSFIFQTVCDAEIDIPNQMARMAAAYEWITTGKAYVAPEEPRKRGKGGHLTPVEP